MKKNKNPQVKSEDKAVDPSISDAPTDSSDVPALTDDYQVGYGKPPKASQFQPGTSGNKSGKKKTKPSVKDRISRALNERVPVTVRAKTKRMTKLDLMLTTMANKAAKGDIQAANFLLKHQDCADTESAETLDIDNLEIDDKALISTFLDQFGMGEPLESMEPDQPNDSKGSGDTEEPLPEKATTSDDGGTISGLRNGTETNAYDGAPLASMGADVSDNKTAESADQNESDAADKTAAEPCDAGYASGGFDADPQAQEPTLASSTGVSATNSPSLLRPTTNNSDAISKLTPSTKTPTPAPETERQTTGVSRTPVPKVTVVRSAPIKSSKPAESAPKDKSNDE